MQRRLYTGFGRKLRIFMADRDIHSWTELSERILAATGRKYTHQSMSKYAAGIVEVPTQFVKDFATILELTPTGRTALAEQYVFHSRANSSDEQA